MLPLLHVRHIQKSIKDQDLYKSSGSLFQKKLQFIPNHVILYTQIYGEVTKFGEVSHVRYITFITFLWFLCLFLRDHWI